MGRSIMPLPRNGQDFPGDREVHKPVILSPHKHAALAKRLYEESNAKRAAISALLGARKRPAATKAKRPGKGRTAP